MPVKRIGIAILAGAVAGIAAAPAAARAAQQTQSPSLADLARKEREQKKSQPKQRVWTNDNIPTTPGTISVVGNAAPPAPPVMTPPGGTTGQPSAEDIANAQRDLNNAKQDVANKKTDLDLLQRDYDLKNATISGSPSYPSDRDGQALLKRMQQQMADKKQEIQDAEQKVKDLENKLAELKAAAPTGVMPTAPPSPETAPEPPTA